MLLNLVLICIVVHNWGNDGSPNVAPFMGRVVGLVLDASVHSSFAFPDAILLAGTLTGSQLDNFGREFMQWAGRVVGNSETFSADIESRLYEMIQRVEREWIQNTSDFLQWLNAQVLHY